MKKRIVTVLFILICTSALLSQTNPKKVDHLGIAAVLIRDGNYERAENALKKVDLSDEKVDKVRYYTLLGLVQLRKAEYGEAVGSFQNAIAEGQEDPVIYAYIAQGYFAQGKYEDTLEAISKLPSINQFPDLYGIKSQSYWQLGDVGGAFGSLEKGISLFPKKGEFLQLKITYLLDLELNQEAARISREFLELEGKDNPEIYITIAQALSRAGETNTAVHVLEMAKLRFPDNQRVRLGLAKTYLQDKRYHTAARILEEAAVFDQALISEAAELYRMAGNYTKATYLNSLVSDQTAKTKQRFNILLETGRFEEARALQSRMERIGVFQDEQYVYAMAYVLFELQKYDESINYLNMITSSDLFRQATQLRQAIEIMKKESITLF